ncbi:hypothetical protein MM26B8_05000 [Mycoplasmopsis meleagridis]|uniref:ABM domain-containing protein n=2 Tax=Mycoplasmopsis meleagridis TaxID=29561 RepID=A0A0F5H1F3_9BACT|nr:antibiotic biosynthesis monooxygenase [Mycoplasmopsis meleagridis]KKB26692.1 hypothetical protein MMELEA_00740 [Mycoplasmopsis meleagridis ATCC 25294]KUH47609.1 hypothetical protein ASB56_00525 [Mycoplasmopsis meleagridis]OAD18192.1 hypothetical protein MM26B8_05000 [Mycoplasmopsis meleagridis]VEU77747.1 Uncharacterised protein [Mycoplasmopsis meleagridis]
MIFIISKELKIKKEMKANFLEKINAWIIATKKQELNLSIDGMWKDQNHFLIIERWSTEESYEKYISSELHKNLWREIKPSLLSNPYLNKFKTISW